MGLVIITRLFIILVIIIFTDFWAIKGLGFVFAPKSRFPKRIVLSLTVPFLIAALVVYFIHGMPGLDPVRLRAYYVIATAFMIIYFSKLGLALPVFIEALLIGLGRTFKRLIRSGRKFPISNRGARRRSLMVWPGLAMALLLLVAFLEGTFLRKHQWVLREVEIPLSALPSSFDGFRIVQFSDTHLGSFFSESSVNTGISLIRNSNPDLVVFTGDLINTDFSEALPYTHLFRQIVARDNKFAILGNHDIDDYRRWTQDSASEENIRGLEDFWQKTGFDLLRNQFRYIIRDDDTLVIAGVDNWGLPPFKQHGNLAQALQNTGTHPVVLLSHDPSHWKAEIIDYDNVLLTLSGHTHAMQMGFRFSDFSWSPSSWMYPEWTGLYSAGDKFLYVNPGFGYIGFLGRVGIRPEITVIILKSVDQ